ncbi:phosphoribosyltransferase domain-containing protein [Rivihabitans pingtungensis]|nr:phosphoribosyltransferase domain-containing protein [Rivihabitans pingtungensis]
MSQTCAGYPASLGAHLPGGRLDVNIETADLPAEALFTFAARENPKRAFLFLSHVLGKHLPVRPLCMHDTHQRLAARIPSGLPGPVVFISMAETATALGQGVFEAWQAQHPSTPSVYLHTTRYRVLGHTPISFAEPHSHAPRQLFFLPEHPDLHARFTTARSLVMIDDEISTGQTFVNLATACRRYAPHLDSIHLSTLTDFAGTETRQVLPARMQATLSTGSLLTGDWRFSPNADYHCAPLQAQAHPGKEAYVASSSFGRLGRDTPLCLTEAPLKALASSISTQDRVLVLGTGEFMYPAYILARELNCQFGIETLTHATTRSPILAWGPITHVETFADNYGEGIANYLYNCTANDYDQILLCHETGPHPALRDLATRLRARLIHFRSESDFAEDFIH